MIDAKGVARRCAAADADYGVALAFQRRPVLLEARWVPLAMDRIPVLVGDGNADHIRVLHLAVGAGEYRNLSHALTPRKPQLLGHDGHQRNLARAMWPQRRG